MKKVLIITLVITMLFSLVACGGGGNRTTRDPTEDFSEFRWPNSAIASLLPVPNSSFGRIWIESSSQLSVDVGNTTQAEFNAYVDGCMNKGFNVDYARLGNDFFTAENEAGYSLLLSFNNDNEIMTIALNAPREDEPEPEPEDEPELEVEPEQTPELPDENDDEPITSDVEWREFLRLYEEWIDRYIEILEKYNADPTDLSILNDYLEMMVELAEWAEMAEQIEVDLANDPNALREYMETLSRIIIKLSEVEL